jgi:hypothetical protein
MWPLGCIVQVFSPQSSLEMTALRGFKSFKMFQPFKPLETED